MPTSAQGGRGYIRTYARGVPPYISPKSVFISHLLKSSLDVRHFSVDFNKKLAANDRIYQSLTALKTRCLG